MGTKHLPKQEGRTGISSLSRVCHQRMLVQWSRFVIRGLQDGGSSHGSLGSCHQGEVLARDAQKDLPGSKSAVEMPKIFAKEESDEHCVSWRVGNVSGIGQRLKGGEGEGSGQLCWCSELPGA